LRELGATVADDAINIRSLHRILHETYAFDLTHRQQLPKFCRKILAAMRQTPPPPGGLIICVWDRDGDPEKLHHRDILRARLQGFAIAGCAGVCIEAVEALLLADEGSFVRAFGCAQPRLPGSPEQVPEPKSVLRALLDSLSVPGAAPAQFALLAENVDLALLGRRCRRSYWTLRQDMRAAVSELV
jgi:hypothetical protein